MSFQYHAYPNGLRIIYEKSKTEIPLSYIYLFCDVGSAHEPDNLRGVSHFIEHMCFKGTKKIPKAKDIFIEYDKIGADFNAFTIKRATCYMVTCQNDYFHNCFSILGDMVLNSTFSKKEYEKEYEVVMEENIDDNNDFEEIIYVNSDALLYKGSSYANPVDSIKYHSKGSYPNYKDVLDFYHDFYKPENMVVSVVSTMPFSKIKSLISSTFLSKKTCMKPNLTNNIVINHTLAPQQNIQFHLEKKNGVENTLLTIGFRTCAMNSTDKYKLELLKTILVGGMSGRLFMLLREKHGLTYSVRVETENHEKTGVFTIFTQTESSKLLKNGSRGKGVLPLLIDCLGDLIKNGVTDNEVDIAKGNQEGDWMIQSTKNANRAEYNGFEFLVNNTIRDIIPYDDIYKKCIRNLKKNDVRDVIRKYFTRDRMTVCLLSDKLPSLGVIQKYFDEIS